MLSVCSADSLRVTNAHQEAREAAASTTWPEAWWGNRKMTDQDTGLHTVAHSAQTEQPGPPGDLTQCSTR